jgi:hypothetical protein
MIDWQPVRGGQFAGQLNKGLSYGSSEKISYIAVGDFGSIEYIEAASGGNAYIKRNIQVEGNVWDKSAAETTGGKYTPVCPPDVDPTLCGSGGYERASSTGDFVCPFGEYMIGLTKNALGVNQLICARL